MYLWPFGSACSCTSNTNLHSAFQSKLLVHLKPNAKSSKVEEYKHIKSSPIAKEHLKSWEIRMTQTDEEKESKTCVWVSWNMHTIPTELHHQHLIIFD